MKYHFLQIIAVFFIALWVQFLTMDVGYYTHLLLLPAAVALIMHQVMNKKKKWRARYRMEKRRAATMYQ